MIVIGQTGSGKSVFLLSLIHQLRKEGYPVLVISGAKYEMRKLLKSYSGKSYTPGNDIAPIRANPFEIPEGSDVASHKNAVVELLASAVSMPTPLDSLLICAVDEAYKAFGYGPKSTWKDGTPFGIRDFLCIYKRMMASSEYSLEVKGNLTAAPRYRLLALLQRAGEMMDCVHSSFKGTDLLEGLTVVELEGLTPCDRKLAGLLILTSVIAKLQSLPETDGKLQLALVIDEANALLSDEECGKGTDSSWIAGRAIRDKMVEVVTTMRSRGIGLIYADQTITNAGGNKLFDNTVTKCLFRLEGVENHCAVEGLRLTPKEAKCLLNLSVGQCLMKSHSDTELVGLTTIYRSFGSNVSDAELRLIAKGSQPITDTPEDISARLLSDDAYPSPSTLFAALRECDVPAGKRIALDLEKRARLRGLKVPACYRELMNRYFEERQKGRI